MRKQRDIITYIIATIESESGIAKISELTTEYAEISIGQLITSKLLRNLPIGKQYTILYNVTKQSVIEITCEHIKRSKEEREQIREMLGIKPITFLN